VNCASCGASNQADAVFCEECGASFGRECPSCGASYSPRAKFCRNVEPLSAATLLRKPANGIPARTRRNI
jgi:ribosomal protein L40E